MGKLVFRAVLCVFALAFVFTVFTATASLQSNTSSNALPNSNFNAPRRISPPRVSSTRRSNTNTMVLVNTMPSGNYLPVSEPEPPAKTTLRGRVFYADTGRAVKRASIMLMSEDLSGGPSSSPSALTDNEGRFQIKDLRAGTYYAIVNAPGVVSPLAYFDFSVLMNRGNEKDAFAKAFEGFEKIVVDGLNDADAQIAARRGGAIGGRVMYDDGDPAVGVKIEILRKVEDKYMSVIPNLSAMFSMRSGSGTSLTDDRGVYRFPGLPPGDYIVKVTESVTHSENSEKQPSYDPFEGNFGADSLLTTFYPDAAETGSAQLLRIEYGQEIPEVNLTIASRNLFRVEGRVVARRDKSPVKARITLKREGGEDSIFSILDSTRRRQQPALTDEDGNWKFRELPKGVYRLIVEPVEDEDEYQRYRGNYGNTNMTAGIPPRPQYAKKVLEITIGDKDQTKTVVELGSGATVSGTIAVENSRELPPSVTVQALSVKDEIGVSDSISNYGELPPAAANSNRMSSQLPGRNDRDFKLANVIEGKNTLIVSVEGDYYVKSATAGGVDLLAASFEVREGEFLQNVQIVFGKDPGTLIGRVLNDRKAPVSGAGALLVPTDGRRKNASFYRSVATNEEGKFESRLAPGEYAVIFADKRLAGKKDDDYLKLLEEMIKDAPTVKIEAGKTENLTIEQKK